MSDADYWRFGDFIVNENREETVRDSKPIFKTFPVTLDLFYERVKIPLFSPLISSYLLAWTTLIVIQTVSDIPFSLQCIIPLLIMAVISTATVSNNYLLHKSYLWLTVAMVLLVNAHFFTRIMYFWAKHSLNSLFITNDQMFEYPVSTNMIIICSLFIIIALDIVLFVELRYTDYNFAYERNQYSITYVSRLVREYKYACAHGGRERVVQMEMQKEAGAQGITEDYTLLQSSRSKYSFKQLCGYFWSLEYSELLQSVPSSLLVTFLTTLCIILYVFGLLVDISILFRSNSESLLSTMITQLQSDKERAQERGDSTTTYETMISFYQSCYDAIDLFYGCCVTGATIATICAIIALCYAVVSAFLEIKLLRKGKGSLKKYFPDFEGLSLSSACQFMGCTFSAGYFGLICLCILLDFVFFFLFWKETWIYIWETDWIRNWLIGLIMSTAIKMSMDYFIADGYLSKEGFVSKPIIWSYYFVYSSFYGFLTMSLAALTRFTYLIIISFFVLLRVDYTIFPQSVRFLDSAFYSYYSWILTIHRHSNPIVTAFGQLISQSAKDNTLSRNSRRIRNKWQLAMRLVLHPELIQYRRP